MRVSAQTKAATRRKILEVSRQLFGEKGFERTTTRDIAEGAEIASGTLFNYFATKEAIVAALASDASGEMAGVQNERGESLEEDLFALVAGGLRKLRPFRRYLPALLETTLSPLAMQTEDESALLRVSHLEAVSSRAATHGYPSLSATALQLYWTLYTGILVFWSNDKSPKQEDTLALIDESLNMYVAWLREQSRADATDRNR